MPTPEEHAKKAIDGWLHDPSGEKINAMDRPTIFREPDDLTPWIAEEIRQANAAALQTAITAIGTLQQGPSIGTGTLKGKTPMEQHRLGLEAGVRDRTIDEAIDAIRAIMREGR